MTVLRFQNSNPVIQGIDTTNDRTVYLLGNGYGEFIIVDKEVIEFIKSRRGYIHDRSGPGISVQIDYSSLGLRE
jgi:hypothetical protein